MFDGFGEDFLNYFGPRHRFYFYNYDDKIIIQKGSWDDVVGSCGKVPKGSGISPSKSLFYNTSFNTAAIVNVFFSILYVFSHHSHSTAPATTPISPSLLPLAFLACTALMSLFSTVPFPHPRTTAPTATLSCCFSSVSRSQRPSATAVSFRLHHRISTQKSPGSYRFG